MAYCFSKRETLQDGVRRIAREQIDAVIDAIALSKPDGEAVHAARKALKKLRSLLRLIRKEIGEEVFLRESACCRDAGRLLSSARDADVRLATFDSLAASFNRHSLEGTSRIRAALLDDARGARHSGLSSTKRKALARTLEMARARMLLLEINEGWKVLKHGLQRSFKRAQESFEATFAQEPAPEALHNCRKRFKDLNYQLGLLRPAFGSELRKIEAMADKMGELLGNERDLGLLCENLNRRVLDGVLAGADVCGKIAQRQNQIQKKAQKLGHKIVNSMSDAFPKAMGKSWKKWRAGGVAA